VPTYISVLNVELLELEQEGVAPGPGSFPPLPEDVAHPSTAGWLLQTVIVVPSLQMDPGALDALHLLDLEPSHLVQSWLVPLVLVIIATTDQDLKIDGINPSQQQHLHLLLEVVIIIITTTTITMQMPISKMEGGANREEEEVKMMAMVTGDQEKHTT
jgi:hypothetical protein